MPSTHRALCTPPLAPPLWRHIKSLTAYTSRRIGIRTSARQVFDDCWKTFDAWQGWAALAAPPDQRMPPRSVASFSSRQPSASASGLSFPHFWALDHDRTPAALPQHSPALAIGKLVRSRTSTGEEMRI